MTYRHPGLLAKVVSTLDVLSGGRAVLGLGAAWYEREHAAYGVPFPPLKERFERLEETLQIVAQMWGPDNGPYAGRHYQLAETICSPQPLRPVPVMVGGGGEKKTLRLVARYADACNLFAGPRSPAEAVAAKLEVLRGALRAGGDRLRPDPQERPVGRPVRPHERGGRAGVRGADGGVCRGRRHRCARHAVGRGPGRVRRGAGRHVVPRLTDLP